MHSIRALMRAAFLSAASYRLQFLLSIVALLASVVPIYFVAGALQPVVAESIRAEGSDYFSFLMVGIGATYLISAAVSSLPGAIGGSLASGTFEALLATRASLPSLIAGLVGYPLLLSGFRAFLLLVVGALVGVDIAWSRLPLVLPIALLLIAAYVAFGLVAAALILAYRTAGPLVTAVTTGSLLLGGVYYSTSVIPSWIQTLSSVVPLTYALRATRVLLLGDPTSVPVGADLLRLGLLTAAAMAGGAVAFGWALRYARRAGTLSQY